jgi:phytoene synthase
MSIAFGFPNDATPPGSAAYYVVRFARPPVRDDLSILFAWYANIQDLRTISDPGVARLKLKWWSNELGRAADGQATHPLAQRMSRILARESPGTAPFDAITEAMDGHLSSTGYSTAAQVAQYHRATAGTFASLIAALTADGDPTGPVVHAAGTFQAAVDTLGRLGAELAARVPLVPRRALEFRSADPDAFVTELCDHAAALHPGPTGDLPPALAGLTGLADARLAEIRRTGSLVLRTEVDLTPLRKLWTVWRCR